VPSLRSRFAAQLVVLGLPFGLTNSVCVRLDQRVVCRLVHDAIRPEAYSSAQPIATVQ